MFWIFVFINKYKRPPAGYGQALPRRTVVARKENLNCLPKIPKGTFWPCVQVKRTDNDDVVVVMGNHQRVGLPYDWPPDVALYPCRKIRSGRWSAQARNVGSQCWLSILDRWSIEAKSLPMIGRESLPELSRRSFKFIKILIMTIKFKT